MKMHQASKAGKKEVMENRFMRIFRMNPVSKAAAIKEYGLSAAVIVHHRGIFGALSIEDSSSVRQLKRRKLWVRQYMGHPISKAERKLILSDSIHDPITW